MATSKSAKSSRNSTKAVAKPAKGKSSVKPKVTESSEGSTNELSKTIVANQKATENSGATVNAKVTSKSEKTNVNATMSVKLDDSTRSSDATDSSAATSQTKSTDDVVRNGASSQFEVFEMKNMEIPTAVREVAEKTVEQARETYDKFKNSAEEATTILEDSIETSRKGIIEIHAKVLDAAKANTGATFEFCKDLMEVKSFSEVVELQSAFTRKQFDAVSSQQKGLQNVATKLYNDVSAPAKEVVERAFSEIRVA